MTIEPFDIPEVAVARHKGIFSPLQDRVASRLAQLNGNKVPFGIAFSGFLRWLLDDIDVAAYARVQQSFLRPRALGDQMQMLKFLDSVFWFEAKMRVAWRLGIHRTEQ